MCQRQIDCVLEMILDSHYVRVHLRFFASLLASELLMISAPL